VEIVNLALITGKLGKSSCGIITLKEKNNSQGLIDMGISRVLKFGGKLNGFGNDNFMEKGIKNLFIYGEDPVGCITNKDEIKNFIRKSSFVVVQDYFITETAELADLILPASLPAETGGTYTNTQKYILSFEPAMESKVETNNWLQLTSLMTMLGKEVVYGSIHDITFEMASALRELDDNHRDKKYGFMFTEEDNFSRNFDFGCDYIVKHFEDKFIESFNN